MKIVNSLELNLRTSTYSKYLIWIWRWSLFITSRNYWINFPSVWHNYNHLHMKLDKYHGWQKILLKSWNKALNVVMIVGLVLVGLCSFNSHIPQGHLGEIIINISNVCVMGYPLRWYQRITSLEFIETSTTNSCTSIFSFEIASKHWNILCH